MSVTAGEIVQKVEQDRQLRRELEVAADEESRIAAFRKAGLRVTSGDLANAKAAMEKGELSDADLERVAGGSVSGWVTGVLTIITAFA